MALGDKAKEWLTGWTGGIRHDQLLRKEAYDEALADLEELQAEVNGLYALVREQQIKLNKSEEKIEELQAALAKAQKPSFSKMTEEAKQHRHYWIEKCKWLESDRKELQAALAKAETKYNAIK